MFSRRCRPQFFLALCAVLLLGLVTNSDTPRFPLCSAHATPVPEQRKTDDKAKAQNAADFKALQQLYGEQPVSIWCNGEISTAGVRIRAVLELFGKQYLQVETNDNKMVLIRADIITKIKQE